MDRIERIVGATVVLLVLTLLYVAATRGGVLWIRCLGAGFWGWFVSGKIARDIMEMD